MKILTKNFVCLFCFAKCWDKMKIELVRMMMMLRTRCRQNWSSWLWWCSYGVEPLVHELRKASVEPNTGVTALTVPHCMQHKVEVGLIVCLGVRFSACSLRHAARGCLCTLRDPSAHPDSRHICQMQAPLSMLVVITSVLRLHLQMPL